MTHCDSHCIVSIEIFRIKLLTGVFDFSATLISILFFHFDKFILHHLLAELWIIENLLEISDEFFQFLIFSVKLIDTQTCQL